MEKDQAMSSKSFVRLAAVAVVVGSALSLSAVRSSYAVETNPVAGPAHLPGTITPFGVCESGKNPGPLGY
jgi:hypothetical protein